MSEFIPFIIKVIYVFVIGLVLAALEVQIEGKHGWALPSCQPGGHAKAVEWGSSGLGFLKKI